MVFCGGSKFLSFCFCFFKSLSIWACLRHYTQDLSMRYNINLLRSLITIRSSSRDSLLKQVFISLHFVSFSWNLSKAAHKSKVSTAVCMLLVCPLSIVSEMVQSSTYFHSSKLGMSSSLIIIMKNQGPNLVP